VQAAVLGPLAPFSPTLQPGTVICPAEGCATPVSQTALGRFGRPRPRARS